LEILLLHDAYPNIAEVERWCGSALGVQIIYERSVKRKLNLARIERTTLWKQRLEYPWNHTRYHCATGSEQKISVNLR